MEAKRVLKNPLFLATLAALLLLNAFFFIYQQTDGQGDFREYGNVYHRELNALIDLSWEEGLARCEVAEQEVLENWGSGNNIQRHEIIQQITGQYEYLLGYEDYLGKIDADAAKLQSVSLFADPNSTAYQNTVKTAEDFHAMDGVSVSMGHDLAVTEVFADKWADYSIVILICVVCGLFVSERKEGLWPMIYAAPGGRWKLVCKRISILFVAAWIGTVLIVGSKILLCGWVFHGLGEWDRVLQSIPMFQNVPTPFTIAEFWLLYIAVKALGAFWIGLVLWAVLSAISNLGLALTAAGLLMGLEFACTAIPSSSMFAVLRYVNVFSYVDFIPVFSRYLNISVFGGLISGSDLVLAILPFLCLFFAGLNVLIVERKHPVSASNRLLHWADGMVRKLDPKLPWCGEFGKLLIKRKGAILLIILAIVAIRMEEPPRAYVPYDPYIQHYQSEFAGPITDDTITALDEALSNAKDTGNQIGLTTVLESAQNAPEGAWILPTAPYDAIWSNNLNNYHRRTALITMLFLVLTLAPIASQERQNNMTVLLTSTSGGRKRLWLRKQVVLLAVTAFVWLVVYGGELIHTVNAYGVFQCLSAPAFSLELFHNAAAIPLGGMIVLYYGAKLLVLFIIGEICYILSSRCSKNRDAILVCCAVLIIPAALAAIGSAVGELMSFLMPLSGVELFTVLI
jgi:hypothetical protein